MGTILAKVGLALVLLDWHTGSTARLVVTVGVTWSAVHAYMGAIFVAVGVCLVAVLERVWRGDWGGARRAVVVSGITVAVLQLPYVFHRLSEPSDGAAMGIVLDSVRGFISNATTLAIADSRDSYVSAVQFVLFEPWPIPLLGWVLVACGVIVAVRHRRDLALLTMVFVPQLAAIVGYAMFLGELEHYYYLSLMPGTALLFVLAVAASVPARWADWVAIGCVAVALVLVPEKVRLAETMHRMPEYRIVVDGARRILNTTEAVRAITTEFPLPYTADPEFPYTILGGRIDPGSPRVAIILSDGRVQYEEVERP